MTWTRTFERNSREAGCCKGCSLCCCLFIEAHGVEITQRVSPCPPCCSTTYVIRKFGQSATSMGNATYSPATCSVLAAQQAQPSKLNEEAVCKGAPSDYRSDSTCATVATGKSLGITCCFVSSLLDVKGETYRTQTQTSQVVNATVAKIQAGSWTPKKTIEEVSSAAVILNQKNAILHMWSEMLKG